MYQYANSFTCACPNDKSVFYINFNQNTPIFDDDGEIEDAQTTPVSSIVIDAEAAKALISNLSTLLDNEDEIEQ